MDLFSGLNEDMKKKVVASWSKMPEDDKSHFVNQISLGLSVWGSDDTGKLIAIKVLEALVHNGSKTLSDFGLYIDAALKLEEVAGRSEKIKRAAMIIDGYRIKNSLSSEPHVDIGI